MVEPGHARQAEVTAGEADAGLRLDRLLANSLPEMSRSRLKALIEAGQVRAGADTIVEPSYRVKPGQSFAIIIPQPAPASPIGQAIPLEILHEDADLIVVNKPAGMAVHPAPGSPDTTLVNALIAHCGATLSGIGGVMRPGIVHRLDRQTSGVILVARTDAAHRDLAAQFASRQVEKEYLAVVRGAVKREHDRVDAPIERDPVHRIRMTARTGRGRKALTEYWVTARSTAANFTELRVRIHTGRTHQIRVHMASIGHPVAGDSTYGAPPEANLGRFFLHARRIAFRSPASGEPVEVESPLPPELAAWRKQHFG